MGETESSLVSRLAPLDWPITRAPFPEPLFQSPPTPHTLLPGQFPTCPERGMLGWVRLWVSGCKDVEPPPPLLYE